jgi:hypothetical protein
VVGGKLYSRAREFCCRAIALSTTRCSVNLACAAFYTSYFLLIHFYIAEYFMMAFSFFTFSLFLF